MVAGMKDDPGDIKFIERTVGCERYMVHPVAKGQNFH